MERGVDEAWERCIVSPPGKTEAFTVRELPFRKEMPAVQKQLLHRSICRAAGRSRDVEAVHVSALLDLFGRAAGQADQSSLRSDGIPDV